jgi:hypothetical protein
MKTIIYSFGLVLSCCLLNSCGNGLDSYENANIDNKSANSGESSFIINADEEVLPTMEPTLKVIKGPMQCVCIKAPCNCSPYSPANPSADTIEEDNFGLSIKPVTCMCIKAPCNCPKPPAVDKKAEEVEELY